MELVIILLAALIVLFASALLFGAPYVPTLRRQKIEAFELLNLKPGQTLLELGSGDGRILRQAAKRGIRATGYEINPLLVLYSKLACWPHRRLAKTHWRNFWHVPLDGADGIYVFLLEPYMAKLDRKITAEATKPLKVVSFAFAFPEREPLKDQSGLMLYEFRPKQHQHTSLKV